MYSHIMGGLNKSFVMKCALMYFIAGVLSVENVVARNLSLEFNKLSTGPTAFTTVLDQEKEFRGGEVVILTKILNNAGNGYNTATGVFTAPVAGTYIFSFQIEHWDTNSITVHLMLDNEIKCSAVLTPAGKSAQSSGTAVLTINAGDRVWLESTGGFLYGSPLLFSTAFSGAFLH